MEQRKEETTLRPSVLLEHPLLPLLNLHSIADDWAVCSV